MIVPDWVDRKLMFEYGPHLAMTLMVYWTQVQEFGMEQADRWYPASTTRQYRRMLRQAGIPIEPKKTGRPKTR